MKPETNERLYLVCVHYALKRPTDWQWKTRKLGVNYDSVIPRLADDLRYLRRVLRPRPASNGQLWKGFAFIFLDPGWTDVLGGGSPVHMAALGADLNTMQIEVENRLANNETLRDASDPKSERIVTAGNLLHLLSLLDEAARGRGESFYRLFAGGAQTLRYDAPKVIEAAIRIANIGSGAPLFRFDDDVIFYGKRSPDIQNQQGRDMAASAAAESILRLCERYQNTLEDPLIRYFVYSGGYDAPSEEELKTFADNDSRFLNGFATRVLQLTELPQQRMRETEDATQGVIKAAVVKAFLGKLVELGANPFRQVVSGAGLCLSDGAILDLPPYSNMHLNVMWIDDHLKYALHDELGHFGRWTRTHHHYAARMFESRFSQLRHVRRNNGPLFTYKDVMWHIQTYMVRLILGCVADAWLRKKSDVKKSLRSLPENAYNELVQSVPYIYGDRFMDVVPGGWDPFLGRQPEDQFRQNLWRIGCERLQKTVELWSDSIYEHTFLGLFVHGCAHPRYEEFKDFFPSGIPKGLTEAVNELPDQYQNAQRPSLDAAADDPSLEQALVTLVDDFVDYLSLVQFWPFFIQSVRCFQNQHTQYRRHDLEWMFPITE